MKAYEPGERWTAGDDGLVFRGDGTLVADANHSAARLIAESPERDELLRDLRRLMAAEAEYLGPGYRNLFARIDATLRRSEG